MEQPGKDQERGVRLVITNGRTIISRQDLTAVMEMNLYLDPDGYVRGAPWPYTYLHNWIMQHRNPALPVDHINECTWDNRRSNLRILTRAENTDRPRRLDEEEARLLEDYQEGRLLASEVHEWLRERRNRGKL